MDFFNQFVRQGSDGRPIFVGREDPNNRPVQPPTQQGQMECPICHAMVDYLVGEDTNDGGRIGCESCWKPSKGGAKHERQETQSGDPTKIVFD